MADPSPPIAIIPAAGLGRRMGCPKLLLSFEGRSIIRRLIEELKLAEVKDIIVVTRRSDVPLNQEVDNLNILRVSPEIDPPDMRTSVEFAIAKAQERWGEERLRDRRWLLIPADHPILHQQTMTSIQQASHGLENIIIPTYGGQRGHPTLFPPSLMTQVRLIPADKGLNWLVRSRPDAVVEVTTDDPDILLDLDTPEDYARLLQRSTPCLGSNLPNAYDFPSVLPIGVGILESEDRV